VVTEKPTTRIIKIDIEMLKPQKKNTESRTLIIVTGHCGGRHSLFAATNPFPYLQMNYLEGSRVRSMVCS